MICWKGQIRSSPTFFWCLTSFTSGHEGPDRKGWFPDETASLLTINGPESPALLRLTCTHILQTEVKSKMNALNKCLQGEPALPQGFPARRAIRPAGLVATHACHLRPEVATGQGLARLASACSDDRQRFGVNHLCCWLIWGLTRQIAPWRACARPPQTTVPTGGSALCTCRSSIRQPVVRHG